MAKTSAKTSFSITNAKTFSVIPTKTDAKTFTMCFQKTTHKISFSAGFREHSVVLAA